MGRRTFWASWGSLGVSSAAFLWEEGPEIPPFQQASPIYEGPMHMCTGFVLASASFGLAEDVGLRRHPATRYGLRTLSGLSSASALTPFKSPRPGEPHGGLSVLPKLALPQFPRRSTRLGPQLSAQTSLLERLSLTTPPNRLARNSRGPR